MTNDNFWKLIGLIDKDKLNDGDDIGALRQLQLAVIRLPEDQIFLFDNQLAQALYDIDGSSFCDESGENRESDDGFLYARCWVVAQGKIHYLKTIADPKIMPKSSDQWCELLLYVGQNAWEFNNSAEPGDYPHTAEPSFESGSNENNW